MKNPIKITFAVLPKVHLIDLAGPVQVFYEANQFGADFHISYCSIQESIASQQDITFSGIQHFKEETLSEKDYLFVAGTDFMSISQGQLRSGYDDFFNWLQCQYRKGVNICSVCSGTYVLAASKLLKNKSCTTHWKCVEHLKRTNSDIKLVNDQLFVKDGNLYTSAGMTSGIDMALFIVEEHYGPIITSKVAREMVVFIRRSGSNRQESIYLDFRNHIHPAVHQVQDYLLQNPSAKTSIEELANMFNISERNLTRLFKKLTGISINEYRTKCRLAYAESLMNNPELTIEYIAIECGFKDPKQLRRLWKSLYKISPSAHRNIKVLKNLDK